MSKASSGGSVASASGGQPKLIPAVDRGGGRVAVSDLAARRVWVAAGGRCTFCKEFLAEDETTGQPVYTGQLAHIVGATPEKGSPRGKSSKTLRERAQPENLMLLCAGEHKVIDTFQHWTLYDEEQLLAFKMQHERDVRELTGLLRKPKSTVIRRAATGTDDYPSSCVDYEA